MRHRSREPRYPLRFAQNSRRYQSEDPLRRDPDHHGRQRLGHTPTQGSIKLLGKDITRVSSEEMHELRTNMGVSFQGGALLSSMTVGENVQLPLREHTKLDDSTMGIMARMKLEVVNLGGSRT